MNRPISFWAKLPIAIGLLAVATVGLIAVSIPGDAPHREVLTRLAGEIISVVTTE